MIGGRALTPRERFLIFSDFFFFGFYSSLFYSRIQKRREEEAKKGVTPDGIGQYFLSGRRPELQESNPLYVLSFSSFFLLF